MGAEPVEADPVSVIDSAVAADGEAVAAQERRHRRRMRRRRLAGDEVPARSVQVAGQLLASLGLQRRPLPLPVPARHLEHRHRLTDLTRRRGRRGGGRHRRRRRARRRVAVALGGRVEPPVQSLSGQEVGGPGVRVGRSRELQDELDAVDPPPHPPDLPRRGPLRHRRPHRVHRQLRRPPRHPRTVGTHVRHRPTSPRTRSPPPPYEKLGVERELAASVALAPRFSDD